MRTHELASLLKALGNALTLLPDSELVSLPSEIAKLVNPHQQPLGIEEPQPLNLSEIPILMTTEDPQPSKMKTHTIVTAEAELGSLQKKEIVELIENLEIPVTAGHKDSAKYVAEKVVKYLINHPNEIRKVNSALRRKRPVGYSESLTKALGVLLGNRDEIPTSHSRQ